MLKIVEKKNNTNRIEPEPIYLKCKFFSIIVTRSEVWYVKISEYNYIFMR